VVEPAVGEDRLGGEEVDDPAVDVEVAVHLDRLHQAGSAIAMRTSRPTLRCGLVSVPK
jgi:hypothetical protein